jgi:hypothetical protein
MNSEFDQEKFLTKCVNYMMKYTINTNYNPPASSSPGGGGQKTPPWPLVRERTIPTDRPPLVDEI